MKSIRSFLLWRLLGGVSLVLVIAGVLVYLVVARSLEAAFDDNLVDRVRGFASILFQEENRIEFEFSDELMPEYEVGEAAAYFQLWFQGGQPLERSNSLGAVRLSKPEHIAEEPQHWSEPLPDGRPGRYVAQLIEIHHVYPEQGPERPQAALVEIVIARGREELVAAERVVLVACATVCLVLILLIAALSWLAVRLGLAPAERLARALDGIRVDHLPERIDVGDPPSELQPVLDKTNALLRRVDDALERERRTTADIAHELRTPISELLTVSEVALRGGEDSETADWALGTIRDVAKRMGRSVSTLLKLARLEMGVEDFESEGVDVGGIVAEQLRSHSALGRERRLRVENGVERAELVEGDQEVLSIVISNLLSNALYYAPEGGSVHCRLERSAADWTLTVENDSADLDPADLETLTEPFWRKDRARADRNHSGLGLALSRALVDKSGMELAFDLEEGRFQARLRGRGRGNGRSA